MPMISIAFVVLFIFSLLVAAAIAVTGSPQLVFFVLLPVVTATLVLVVLFMGFLYGWDTVFSFIRPEKEFRKWTAQKARTARKERRLQFHTRPIPAPRGDDALRDPDFELLVYSGDLDAAEKYLAEAMERSRGGNPAQLAIYTHYLEFLLRLRRQLG
jgi:hypothetical protein